MSATDAPRAQRGHQADREWAVTDSSPVTGIAWYRREPWTCLRDLASDRDKLEESYEDRLAGARRILVRMAVGGVRARRVDIGVGALARWCQAEGRPLDSAARTECAALPLRRAHQAGNPWGPVGPRSSCGFRRGRAGLRAAGCRERSQARAGCETAW